MTLLYRLKELITPAAHKEKLRQYRESTAPVKTERLIAIGYWQSVWEPGFPDPACFQDSEWKDKQAVIQHLKKGQSIADWMGYSWCRFRCDHVVDMGCSDWSDGYYVFPEGLLHYIQDHQVRLPGEFIEHIHRFQPREINFESHQCEIDYQWWKSQRGWKQASSFLTATDEEMDNHLKRIEREKRNKSR